MRILNSCVVLQDSILQPGCAPADPAAHFLCSTALIRQGISTVSFCSCKLLWRSHVFYSTVNAQPVIFAVMNCCVVGSSFFSSDILAWSADSLHPVQWHKISWVRVDQYAYYAKKRRQNVGLETYDIKLWRHKQRTSNKNDHHTPPNVKPPWKISAYATVRST